MIARIRALAGHAVSGPRSSCSRATRCCAAQNGAHVERQLHRRSSSGSRAAANIPYFFSVGNHDVTGMPAGDPARALGLHNTLTAMSKLMPPEGSPRRLSGYPTYAFGYGNASSSRSIPTSRPTGCSSRG